VTGAARVRAVLGEAADLHRRMASERVEAIVAAAAVLTEAAKSGRLVLAFGNGGSAGDAQHLAAEFVGRFQRDRRALAAVALTADPAVVTAVANDRGYDEVFARQIEALGRPGDVALERARAAGLRTVGLTGADGGTTGRIVQVHVNVPHDSPARVQEVHRTILHAICELVEEAL
jgi:D-sedoheptulose 7-phosphate isomerase